MRIMKAFTASAVLLAVLTGCSTVTNVKPVESVISENSKISGQDNNSGGENPQAENITAAVQVTEEPQEVTIPKPTAENSINYEEYSEIFEIDDNGAVVEKKDITELSDSEIKAAGQALYEAACTTQWCYSIGSPYAIDTSQTVQNEFGWTYYLVISDGINSIADVEADYYRVFSRKYTSPVSETFMEQNGRVYALNELRGTNMFYSDSKITGIKSKNDNEIVFTVLSTYTGSPYDDSGYYEDETEFTIVREESTWKVGQFILPY